MHCIAKFKDIDLMKYISIFGVFIILFACKQDKKEVLDMNDIMPQSEKDEIYKPKTDLKDTLDFGFDTKIAEKIGIRVMEIDTIGEPMFPDRFSPRGIKKLNLHLKEDLIVFCQWTYKDSIKTKNALYNWIDCFGPKCKSIKFGQKVNFQKDNFVLLVNDTSITYVSSALKIKAEDWIEYFELKNEIEDWKYVIQQGTRAKAGWYKVVEGKKEELILRQ